MLFRSDKQSMDAAERMMREGFTMDDMLLQMQQIRKMGGLSKLASMIPGVERAIAQAGNKNPLNDDAITRIEAMIYSMTKEERLRPKIINGQRRKRIAAGSGRSVQEVNGLLRQWGEMNKMMGRMRSMTNNKQGKKASMRQMQDMMKRMGMDPRNMRF